MFEICNHVKFRFAKDETDGSTIYSLEDSDTRDTNLISLIIHLMFNFGRYAHTINSANKQQLIYLTDLEILPFPERYFQTDLQIEIGKHKSRL